MSDFPELNLMAPVITHEVDIAHVDHTPQRIKVHARDSFDAIIKALYETGLDRDQELPALLIKARRIYQ